MRVRDILKEKGARLVTIDANRTIHDAIVTLNKNRIGALIVTGEDEEVIGIVTERDILRKCGESHDSTNGSAGLEATISSSCVRDAMTKDLFVGVPDDDPDYAMGVMTKNRIRHLPILDDGKLVGIISIGDLVNAHLEEQVFKSRTLREYISRNGKPDKDKKTVSII